MHAKYSQKQLNEYRQRLLFDQANAKLPKCRQCVGGPADELTCHRCDLTKGLNSFTKVQRRKPDTALCKDCQQEVDDVEPNIEDALEEQRILETQTSIGAHSLYNYDSLRGSLPPMNSHMGGSDARSIVTPTGNPNSDLLRFSTRSSIAGDNEDGVWTGQHTSGHKGKDSGEDNSTRQRAPSVASSAISTGTTGTAWDNIMNAGRPEQSYRTRIGSTRTNLTAAESASKQSGNWAKQGAAKPDRGALREAEKQREALRKVQEQERARYEEEESSGSEWEL
ncbi:hypothetical protein EPUS_01630 [Endocarpon pusillum Z07020]|uniref:Stc1 domain-containing protein n=1 Tax=Endocarpon pusillum (strain Z07020 / HMAS-L-300199) TaxID=1263415 RepID=U1HY76_ENDPU|nr:uncharacterized protein EPUS_01630 [Endocarpon pusillum Z07020]ERF75800.1 hypothetical protein EPUS_01630 [Endocarpon pusillum Z07020]